MGGGCYPKHLSLRTIFTSEHSWVRISLGISRAVAASRRVTEGDTNHWVELDLEQCPRKSQGFSQTTPVQAVCSPWEQCCELRWICGEQQRTQRRESRNLPPFTSGLWQMSSAAGSTLFIILRTQEVVPRIQGAFLCFE